MGAREREREREREGKRGMERPVTTHQEIKVAIDRYFVFHAQSTAKGHIRGKQNVLLPQGKL